MNSVAMNGSLIKMVFQLGSPLATCLIPHMDICTVCPHNPTPTKPAILSPLPPPPHTHIPALPAAPSPTHTCTACCPAAAVLFTLMVVREACLESGEAGLMTCAAV